jgi:hypothetical protein
MNLVDERLFLLFCRETRPQLISEFWADPAALDMSSRQEADPLRADYEAWLATKRQITLKELLQGTWELQDYYKRRYIINFFPDNTYLERELREHNFCMRGKWEMDYHGVPRLKLGSIELDIVADMEGDTYSAVQIVDNEPHDYLRITHRFERSPIPFSIKAA